jgi:thiol-disulfide isomerase/thioredoxin
MKSTVVILTLMFVLSGCNLTRPDSKALTSEVRDDTKQLAPEFDLVNVAGGTMKSSDIKGKVAIIDFWATWCAPCLVEIPNFNKLHALHDGKGVQMLAITVESGNLDSIKSKVAKVDMKYPVLMGDDKVVEGFGGIIGFPTTYVVTKDWRIYKKYLGMTPHKRELIEEDIEELLTR